MTPTSVLAARGPIPVEIGAGEAMPLTLIFPKSEVGLGLHLDQPLIPWMIFAGGHRAQ